MAVCAGELVAIAASVESMSEHPLAASIREYAAEIGAELFSVSHFEALTGSGVKGVIYGKRILGVSYKYAKSVIAIPESAEDIYLKLSDKGETPLFFIRDDELLGIIAVADTVRADSADAIAMLKKMDLKTVMLTGDNERCAKAIAAEVKVDEVIAEVMPRDKAEAVKRLSKDGAVIMVGDGVNDAPALTAADVGMAIGRGTDVAIESCDVVLVSSRLTDVVSAVRLGRATLKTIHENLFFAFIYNVIGIPLAAGVFGLELDPMFGAAAMSLSSFCVVTNALRLNAFRSKYNKTNKLINKTNKKRKKEEKQMKITMKIEGMMCPHCEARVRDVLSNLDCVELAEVSHKDGTAVITPKGECSAELLTKTVTDAGYKVISVE
jgi:Cu2+-exporting ATPase